MSGKVVPNRVQGTMISKAAQLHLTAPTPPPPTAGKMWS